MNKWIVSNMGVALLIAAAVACAQGPVAAPVPPAGTVVIFADVFPTTW